MDVEPVSTRISELWFEDGNIVIQAGNSQFRVHRSILAACSPVFRDMLSFPQPPDSELVEGCPIVLLPDFPSEVTVFLKAIFVPNYFMPFPTITDYSIIKGCLRLSHKYQVEYLRVRALVHLSSRFRTTLVERDTSKFHGRMFLVNHTLSEMISWRNPLATEMYKISIIQLAREVEALWIMPVAFYQLSTYVSASLRDRLASVLRGTVSDGVTISLSPQDQESFFNGHYSQTMASMTMLGFLTSPLDIPGCLYPFKCPRERLSAVDTAIHEVDYTEVAYTPTATPLDMWDEEDWASLEKHVCSTCLAALKTAYETARQEFWEALPEMYGLPPWEELEKMKVAAIGTHWLS